MVACPLVQAFFSIEKVGVLALDGRSALTGGEFDHVEQRTGRLQSI